MNQRRDFLGIDLANRNCAIVRAKIENASITKVAIINEWSSKNGISVKAPFEQIASFYNREMIHLLPEYLDMANLYIGLDFSKAEAHFRNRKENAVVKGFICGYVYHGFLSLNARPLVIPPNVIRKVFKIATNAPKEEVHYEFRRQVKFTSEVLRVWADMTEHARDGLILAFVAYLMYRKSRRTQ